MNNSFVFSLHLDLTGQNKILVTFVFSFKILFRFYFQVSLRILFHCRSIYQINSLPIILLFKSDY